MADQDSLCRSEGASTHDTPTSFEIIDDDHVISEAGPSEVGPTQPPINDVVSFSLCSLCAIKLEELYPECHHESFKSAFLDQMVLHFGLPTKVISSINEFISEDEFTFLSAIKQNFPSGFRLIKELVLLSVGSGTYDARAHYLIIEVAESLGIPRELVEIHCECVYDVLLLQQQQQHHHQQQQQQQKSPSSSNTRNSNILNSPDIQATAASPEHTKKKRLRKYAMIGLASIGGGALIGITGGLAAPIVASAVAGVVGAGSVVMSSAAAGLVGSLFGVAGAGLTASKMNKRMGDLEEFYFQSLTPGMEQTSLTITIAISGWISDEKPEEGFAKPWKYLRNTKEQYCLCYESKFLLELSHAMDYLLSFVVSYATQEALKYTFLASVVAAIAWPTALISIANIIDNPWDCCLGRSAQAGKHLAEILLSRQQGRRPASLIGFSLGARVIFFCLQELAQRGGAASEGIIGDVILLGAPVTASPDQWRPLGRVVCGRIVNGYSDSDWLLKFLYRTSSAAIHVAGLQPIEWRDEPLAEPVDGGPAPAAAAAHFGGRETAPTRRQEGGRTAPEDEARHRRADRRVSFAARGGGEEAGTGEPAADEAREAASCKERRESRLAARRRRRHMNRITNVDLTPLVSGHMDYYKKLTEILDYVNVRTSAPAYMADLAAKDLAVQQEQHSPADKTSSSVPAAPVAAAAAAAAAAKEQSQASDSGLGRTLSNATNISSSLSDHAIAPHEQVAPAASAPPPPPDAAGGGGTVVVVANTGTVAAGGVDDGTPEIGEPPRRPPPLADQSQPSPERQLQQQTTPSTATTTATPLLAAQRQPPEPANGDKRRLPGAGQPPMAVMQAPAGAGQQRDAAMVAETRNGRELAPPRRANLCVGVSSSEAGGGGGTGAVNRLMAYLKLTDGAGARPTARRPAAASASASVSASARSVAAATATGAVFAGAVDQSTSRGRSLNRSQVKLATAGSAQPMPFRRFCSALSTADLLPSAAGTASCSGGRWPVAESGVKLSTIAPTANSSSPDEDEDEDEDGTGTPAARRLRSQSF